VCPIAVARAVKEKGKKKGGGGYLKSFFNLLCKNEKHMKNKFHGSNLGDKLSGEVESLGQGRERYAPLLHQ
jgi:hypothetical protein